MQAGKVRRNEWSPDELDFLCSLAGNAPLPILVKRYNRQASREGWLRRSTMAIKHRLSILGISSRPIFDNFTASYLAETLKVPQSKVLRWLKTGLKSDRLPSRIYRIRVTDFRKWAYQNPSALAESDRDGLQWLMEDDGFVNSLPVPESRSITLKRLDNGDQFGSLQDAARFSFVDLDALQRATRRARRANIARFESAGYWWEIVELAKEQSLLPWSSIDIPISLTELARRLGVKSDPLINKWRAKGIPAKRAKSNSLRLSIREFQQWARQHPQLFATVDRSKLAAVGMDELFLKQVDRCSHHHVEQPKSRILRRLDTGEIFLNTRAAAESIGSNRSTFASAVKGRIEFEYRGIKWQVLNKEELSNAR